MTRPQREKDANTTSIWHSRMAHPSDDIMARIASEANIHWAIPAKDHKCNACMRSKARHATRSTEPVIRSAVPGEVIHSDVSGPYPLSIGGRRWMIIFICEATRMRRVYFAKSKAEVPDKLAMFVADVITPAGHTVKRFHSDNAGEYVGDKMQRYLANRNIRRSTSVPYNPHQNGIAERALKETTEKARAIHIESGLDERFWCYAMHTATYAINRTPTSCLGYISPYEAWTKHKPTLTHMRRFGSLAVMVDETRVGKLNPRGNNAVFLGYALNNPGYYVFHNGRVHTTDDVSFDEARRGVDHMPELQQASSIQWEANYMPINQNPKIEGEHRQQPPTSNPSSNQEQGPDNTQADEHSQEDTQEDTSTEEQPPKLPDNIPRQLAPPSINVGAKSTMLPPRTSKRETRGVKPARISDEQANAVQNKNPALDTGLTDDPATMKEVLDRPDAEQWKESIGIELASIIQKGVWQIVERPRDTNIVKSKWVFKVKRHQSGNIDKYRSRLVAKGYSQIQGEDYFEVFAPVGRHVTLRVLIAHANILNMNIEQSDVSTAFMNADLEEDVYTELPPGISAKRNPRTNQLIECLDFDQTGNSKAYVALLKKSVNGLKQSGRNWSKDLNQTLIEMGFSRSRLDPCLYAMGQGHDALWLVVFVDDMVYTGPQDKIEQFKQDISTKYKVTHGGELKEVLGMQVIRNRDQRRTVIRQTKYITDMVKRFRLDNARRVSSPMDSKQRLTSRDYDPVEGEMGDVRPYNSLVGSLLYAATATRPDIAFAVGQVARFMSKPGNKQWGVAKRILRYLDATKHLGLVFQGGQPGQDQLSIATDSDYAQDEDTRRSTTGYLTRLGTSTLSWASKRQTAVTRSSAEAEYMAMAEGAQEVLYLRQLLHDFDPTYVQGPTTMHADNQGAIHLAKEEAFHPRTRHIDVRAHCIREAVADNHIVMEYHPENKNRVFWVIIDNHPKCPLFCAS